MAKANQQTVFNKLQAYLMDRSSDPFAGFNLDDPVVKVDKIEDFERLRLQKKQLKSIRSQWGKISPQIYSQSLIYEATRIPSYLDYEMMEYYPIIGAALDTMMEESCVIRGGKLLNVYSNSDRIKKELEILFDNIIKIKTTLPMWIRNMCKYGDNFVYLELDDEKGIIDVKQLPNIEIERVDGDILQRFRSIAATDVQPGETVFRWKNQNTVNFKNWQIAHFRLLLDDKRLPYGVSVLEKARRIWKNLLLVEDAMRALVLIRGVDRKAFFVNVGNIDNADVPAYVNDVVDRYKRKKMIDPETGQQDLKMNVLAIDQDYVIPVRGSDDGSRIETVEGQSNFNIEPIQYDLSQLFAALRVPKPFLNYDETVGDGKNLVMQDIRFARTIMRIQQAALQELNKIAMIHLLILGYDDEIDNFSLSLNNPSLQNELLETEVLQAKLNVYKDCVSDAGNGFAPMSMTKAREEILGMSPDEQKLDLERQRLEKAAAEELVNTPQIIPDSGLFDRIDTLYGDPTINLDVKKAQLAQGEGGGEGVVGEAGDFGGGGGGGILGTENLGTEGPPEEGLGEEPGLGGEEFPGETPPKGGEEIGAEAPEEIKPEPPVEESIQFSIKDLNKLLLETEELLKKTQKFKYL